VSVRIVITVKKVPKRTRQKTENGLLHEMSVKVGNHFYLDGHTCEENAVSIAIRVSREKLEMLFD
jgi:hypothetical protein